MKIQKFILLAVLAFLVGFAGLQMVSAHHDYQDKVNLCHKTHSEGNPWVVQSVNANEVQSHLDNGDFLYEGEFGIHTDEAREWCDKQQSEEPTETPTPNSCEGQGCITPTVTASPSATPTVTQTPPCDACGGDGLSDGRSDGRSQPRDVNGEVLSTQVGWK